MDEVTTEDVKEKKHSYCVKVNGAEKVKLEKMASVVGVSVPALFRKLALSKNNLEAPCYSAEDAHGLRVAINRVGNNVNQIAAHLNAGMRTGWNMSFNQVLRDFEAIRNMMLRKCGHN